MIMQDTTLKEMIHIQREAIPGNICDSIVKNIENSDWQQHSWGNPLNDEVESYDRELSVLHADASTLHPFIENALINYQNNTQAGNFLFNVSTVRFNRYGENQIMRPHTDHIRDIFDGEKRGIPIVSVIGNLNDDYEGAKLTFWDGYSVDLGKGDIVAWPSLFLYPHEVTEATQGTRYSFVCWAY